MKNKIIKKKTKIKKHTGTNLKKERLSFGR